MNAQEILNEWGKYSKYDSEQRKFILGSLSWEYHKIGKAISEILPYDPDGTISVLYAKTRFEALSKEAKFSPVSLYDALTDPSVLDISQEKKMWSIFQSEDCKAIEESVLNSLNAIVISAVADKQIGERDLNAEREVLTQSVENVVSALSKCRTELYLRGGELQPIKQFNTSIHVFQTLSECLLTIERSEDGIYICYINNHGSADGYFGFFIKNNGNIFSINERVDEAYPGQHKNSRNGRWAENKKYEFFPYQFIFSFADHDYKGYASKHIINEDDLALFHLQPEGYMPLLLAMVMINYKYSHTDPHELTQVFVDTLLPNNVVKLESTKDESLVVLEGSKLVTRHAEYAINLDSDDILDHDGKMIDHFTDKSLPWFERGDFYRNGNDFYGQNDADLFVELYGKGFELDPSNILQSSSVLALTNGDTSREGELPNFEFVGTKGRMDLIAFQQGRIQLANYIREQMWQKYQDFGGAGAVHEWFENAMRENREYLYRLCVDFEDKIVNHEIETVGSLGWWQKREVDYHYMTMCHGTNGKPNSKFTGWFGYHIPFNVNSGTRYNEKFLCPITGAATSTFFFFRPYDYRDLELLFPNTELPEIIKGWNHNGHRGMGNSILNVTDKVSEIGTLMESDEIDKRNPHTIELPLNKREYMRMNFAFTIGFSKRGFEKLKKELS